MAQVVAVVQCLRALLRDGHFVLGRQRFGVPGFDDVGALAAIEPLVIGRHDIDVAAVGRHRHVAVERSRHQPQEFAGIAVIDVDPAVDQVVEGRVHDVQPVRRGGGQAGAALEFLYGQVCPG
ncbi:hypothetical protein D3C71_1689150 [compost metagenome]